MATEKRNPGRFSIVELIGYGEVFVEQASDPTAPAVLSIEADEALVSRIGSEVRGNRLRLGLIMPWYEWFSFWWTWLFSPKKIAYRLTAPIIEGLEITGSGTMTAAGLKTERCALVLRGSGTLRFGGSVSRILSSLITGSGVIECRGSADNHEIRLAGSGSIRAAELDARQASVRITGSGEVKVSARESLDVAITGSGSVTYSGQPKLQTRVTGSGSVRQEKAPR